MWPPWRTTRFFGELNLIFPCKRKLLFIISISSSGGVATDGQIQIGGQNRTRPSELKNESLIAWNPYKLMKHTTLILVESWKHKQSKSNINPWRVAKRTIFKIVHVNHLSRWGFSTLNNAFHSKPLIHSKSLTTRMFAHHCPFHSHLGFFWSVANALLTFPPFLILCGIWNVKSLIESKLVDNWTKVEEGVN